MAQAPARKLFGSKRRTEVLVLIALLKETFPTEIARLLDAPLYSVQKIVDGLEDDGVVATRLDRRTRIVTLDSRFAAAEQLNRLLTRLIDVNAKIRKIAARRRSRRGRRGKAVT
jgi:DNA-binding MarR family transcriptional regulator